MTTEFINVPTELIMEGLLAHSLSESGELIDRLLNYLDIRIVERRNRAQSIDKTNICLFVLFVSI